MICCIVICLIVSLTYSHFPTDVSFPLNPTHSPPPFPSGVGTDYRHHGVCVRSIPRRLSRRSDAVSRRQSAESARHDARCTVWTATDGSWKSGQGKSCVGRQKLATDVRTSRLPSWVRYIQSVNQSKSLFQAILGYWHQTADERHGNPPRR